MPLETPESTVNDLFSIMSFEDNNEISLYYYNTEPSLKYSLDKTNWYTLNSSTTITLNYNKVVYLKGNNSTYTSSGYWYFNISGKYGVFGNIMSLLYETEFESKISLANIKNKMIFAGFFENTNIVTAENLILPATELTYYKDSVSILGCYNSMFQSCTSLIKAPKILPATTLASYCYHSMFSYCTSLTTAPQLPATTLVDNCYKYMFRGCSKLNHITMLATDISATNCLKDWVSGVASSGTFIKHLDMTTLPEGFDGIPSGWTVEDYVE